MGRRLGAVPLCCTPARPAATRLRLALIGGFAGQWIRRARPGRRGMAGTIWDRLSISAQSADKLNADERVRSWEEVYQGFDLQRARLEAARCIHCPSAPCMEACPVHNDIPAAMLRLEQGDPIGAAQIFRQTSNLPEMCGRLCPQERLCEGDCPVGFAIRPDGR